MSQARAASRVGTRVPDTVVSLLRRDIIGGSYHPRERLVEADLADRYGVKRSAVRSALMQLTNEGLVEREPNRGARVRALSLDEAIEITAVRGVLEGLCAASAARSGTEAEFAHLRELVVEMREKPESDIGAYHEMSAKFHHHIRAMARHATAARLLVQLQNQSVQRHFPLAFATSRPAMGLDEHERIAEAIANRDEAGAEALMREHLTHAIDALRRVGMMDIAAPVSDATEAH